MDTDSLFRALVDQTRRRTLSLLSQHELSVSELVAVLGQPQSTVSRHLRVLRDAALIRDRRNGNIVFYSVPAVGSGQGDDDLTSRVMEWLTEQPLPRSIRLRLDTVVRKRQDMSHRFFDRLGREWDALREESFGPRFQLEAFLALLPTQWTVADIGTGTGYLLPALARHFERVVGVEPVGRMMEAAKQRVERLDLKNVDLRSGDLEQLPIEQASIDLALAVLVLHHVAAPTDALSELYRISRAGGVVLLLEQCAHESQAFRTRMQDRWWGFEPSALIASFESVGFWDCRSRKLATVEPSDDAPDLFVVTARKPDNQAGKPG